MAGHGRGPSATSDPGYINPLFSGITLETEA